MDEEKIEKITRVFLGEGLYLEIHPNGGRYWRFKYRYLSKENRKSLGIYPAISYFQARNIAYKMKKDLELKKAMERKV